ncbi:MAG TPA: hypothetical protein DGT23_34310 [Micromonosporaceae bacterium]|nr:hypothetical protein [Micromonosporaceae bacterium]
MRLDNDGSQEYWLAPGQRWTLAFDGTGWQATTPGWGEGHVYRIADASGPEGSYISWLPTADGGRVDLVPGKEYQVAWESIEDLSHPPQQSRSAVILSTLG